MNIIFNVVMLKHGEDSLCYVKDPLDDFINHLTWYASRLHINDYANCVEVKADYKNGASMSLIFDSAMFNKSTIVATPNTIVLCLMNRRNLNLDWEYEDKSQEVLNYKDALTKENTQNVINIRKDFCRSLNMQGNEYVNVLDSTKKSIQNGEYKGMSDYEIQCAFMDAIRGAYEAPSMRPMISNDNGMYVYKLTNEEQAILNAKPQMQIPLCDRKEKNQIQAYFSNNGEFRPAYMKDFYAKPKIVTTTKQNKHNRPNPQKSLDDFMC